MANSKLFKFKIKKCKKAQAMLDTSVALFALVLAISFAFSALGTMDSLTSSNSANMAREFRAMSAADYLVKIGITSASSWPSMSYSSIGGFGESMHHVVSGKFREKLALSGHQSAQGNISAWLGGGADSYQEYGTSGMYCVTRLVIDNGMPAKLVVCAGQ